MFYNLEASSASHKVNQPSWIAQSEKKDKKNSILRRKEGKQITLHSWHFGTVNHFDFIWDWFSLRRLKCVPCKNCLGKWDQHWIIEIFIRASGVEEWSRRNVFNQKCYYIGVWKTENNVFWYMCIYIYLWTDVINQKIEQSLTLSF